ncbi:D-cysteine desulfhydrase family protein [Natroniella sulfidigena]|uniref:1-aminocyclopropane-1-carboxylate deaminase/D-cysteine desulfhydrase n=1 Tax=Natroniella sulfidigena TaxID=723921 RepID=UPI00200AB7F2|nr:D-cysteine desulfhydrase family protein [Natroniella sulfidigena]MCK8816296.1 D-cysteine desulfhydrase family protein [Natroniella sulfidigena]
MKKIEFCCLPTSLQRLNINWKNNFYIKRDDMTDLALGGNKARKLEYFMQDALNKGADYIVTYGSTHSNHCRMTAAAASKLDLPCLLILAEPDEEPKYKGNFFLYDLFNAEIKYTSTNKVSETIDQELDELKKDGINPYFIYGGGHGNLGTHAYVEAYKEIKAQREELGVNFDYIFFASGTGTTQAGLITGKEIYNGDEEIIGISIARNEERGSEVIEQNIKNYCQENEVKINNIKLKINFTDEYVGQGYGDSYAEVLDTVSEVAKREGILLDPVYTGKAFYGMMDYLAKNNISNKNILFIHTGGTPILFSNAEKFREE